MSNRPSIDAIKSALLDGNRREIIPLPFLKYWDESGVNNTLLKEVEDCELSALEMLLGKTDKPTDAMVIGSAVDTLLCEREAFGDKFYFRPETYVNENDEEKPWNGNAKVCKAWLAEHADRPVLTSDDVTECEAMARAVLSDPRASDLLQQCMPQLCVFWKDKRTGLQMKGRPDLKGPRFAGDLKVTSDARTEAFSKQVANLHYYRQAAIYSDGLEANGEECSDFYLIAVQRGQYPKVNVRRLKLRAIELGRFEYQMLCSQLKDALVSNQWASYSGPGTEIRELDLPEYHYNRGGDLTLTIGGKTAVL